jgi:peptidoglycan-associated lipoprotein
MGAVASGARRPALLSQGRLLRELKSKEELSEGELGMRRLGFIFFALILVLALGVGLSACAKKPAPGVEIPGEGEGEPQEDTSQETIKPPQEVEIPDREETVLADIYFDFDRYNLRSDALSSMEKNARLLREDPGLRLLLEGHCDERGTTEYNLALGERRAKAAYDYLVRYGIDSSRLTTISYGEERPFDPGHDEAAWARNRRVHFVKR